MLPAPAVVVDTRSYLLGLVPLALALGVLLKRTPLPNHAIPFVLLALGGILGVGHGLAMGETPWAAVESAVAGLGAAAIAIAGYDAVRGMKNGAPGSARKTPVTPPPLPLLGLFLVGCSLTPAQAKTAYVATDVGEAACAALVAALAPGFQGLCAVADDELDRLIAAETSKAPPAPPRLTTEAAARVPSKLGVALAVKEFRAARRR